MLYSIMPANLPPEYFEADARYKEARDTSEKVSALEALIATVPKHKGTDKLRADLRRRLSKLREDVQKRKKGGRGDLYNVPKEGAAQAALMGFANSGKSSLLEALTNAKPMIADYPMTTVMPLSGMMPFEDIQFQLVDLPPMGNETTDGWVSGIIRNADIVLMVIDLAEDPDAQAELLMEQASGWKAKKPIIAANKTDAPSAGDALKLLREKYQGTCPVIGVSAVKKDGLEELRRAVFESSGVIRVYSKEPGKEPDMGTPFTVPSGTTVLRLAEIIHKDFLSGLKYACVWGSVRFQGQKVQKDYPLKDRDVVEFHV